jgi:hypothetical protein
VVVKAVEAVEIQVVVGGIQSLMLSAVCGMVFTGAASSVWDTVTGAVGDLFGGGGDSGGWLSDLASGIGSLFGGFFADGGQLGAGKFGIAGENGPEMISGPATITPMGGSTNVTYNINAVDAASFKSMIAADPSFIHAVAQQGGRGVPRRY